MKEKLLTLAVALLAATGAWAQTTFTADNLKYKVTDETTHTVELTGYETAPTDALTIPATVTNGGTTYSVTAIGKSAFELCNALTEVTIPDGVITIGYYAFASCTALTQITLPNGLTSIGVGVFYSCTALKEVTLPEGITYIGTGAFNNCSALAEMTVLATTPPTVGNVNVFLNVSRTIPVYVPAASLAAYQAAEVWKKFTNLQAIGSTGLQTPSMPESIAVYDGMLHNPQGLHLTLYDMQGRQVYSGNDNTVSQPAGVYVVRCNGASGKVLF